MIGCGSVRRSPALGAAAAAIVVVLGGALAGCGSGPSGQSLGQQVTSWAQTTDFVSTLSTLRGDLADEAQYVTSTADKARTVCDVLVTDTLNANQQLPTPDPTLTGLLGKAYNAAAAAGHDCYSGAGGDTTLQADAAVQRGDALRYLIQAEARYDALTSALPSGPASTTGTAP